MGNLGGGEFLVILLVALLVLGPDKLPGAARQVGKVMGDLRRLTSGFQSEVRRAMEVDDKPVTAAVVPDGRPVVATLETAPPAESAPAVDPEPDATVETATADDAETEPAVAAEPLEPEPFESEASEPDISGTEPPIASEPSGPEPSVTVTGGTDGRRPVITLETRPRRPTGPADVVPPAGGSTEPQS